MPASNSKSCAYAGHLGLGKLIAFYDDNGITIAGAFFRGEGTHQRNHAMH